MKSRVKFDAVATIGKYKDKITGEEKKRYATVGTVFESEDGRLSLKLDTIPVGPSWSGYITFYVPTPKDGAERTPSGRLTSQNGAPPPPPTTEAQPDDDSPF